MKWIFAFALAFTSLCPSVFAGPILVGRGAGLGEFNVIYVGRALPDLISMCVSQAECSAQIGEDLKKLASADLNLKLQFLTSKEMGDNLSRRQADGVDINKDKLFTNDEPWTLGDAVSFWVHLLNETKPLTAVEVVASHLSALASAQSSRLQNGEVDYRYMGAVLIEAPFSTLVIDDSASPSPSAVEVPFSDRLDCALSSGVKAPLRHLRVVSALWMSNDISDRAHPRFTLSGALSYTCLDNSGQEKPFSSRYLVHVSLNGTVLDPATLDMSQDRITSVR